MNSEKTVYSLRSQSLNCVLREDSESYRETETHRYTDTQEIQETQDTQDSAVWLKNRIDSIAAAVDVSVRSMFSEVSKKQDCIFVFCRALKAYEVGLGRTLTRAENGLAFDQWWTGVECFSDALGQRGENEALFWLALTKTRIPFGTSSIEIAMRKTDLGVLPQYSKHGESIGRLLTFCYHLQHVAGGEFFLSVRTAAEVLETKNLQRANSILNGLVVKGDLIRTKKGTVGGKHASRYRLP